MLSSCSSLKEFGLYLIAGEVAFIGANAPNPNLVYEDFVTMFSTIKKKLKYKDFNIDFDVYSKKQKEVFSFEVDYNQDWKLFFDLAKRINTNNNMCGGVSAISVGLNIDLIYESIGDIINSDDEYFKTLKFLWSDFMKTDPDQIKIKQKIKELKHSFSINDTRIAELQEI